MKNNINLLAFQQSCREIVSDISNIEGIEFDSIS